MRVHPIGPGACIGDWNSEEKNVQVVL